MSGIAKTRRPALVLGALAALAFASFALRAAEPDGGTDEASAEAGADAGSAAEPDSAAPEAAADSAEGAAAAEPETAGDSAEEPAAAADPKSSFSVPLLDKKATTRPELPEITVSPRIPVLEEGGMYPCSACHDPDVLEPNREPRELEEHTGITLHHGGGRFWCLTCHDANDRDQLRNLKGEPVSYDESHTLCGQCHFQRHRDFYFGSHGKRLESWRGPRKVMPCTGCHDAHNPAIAPRRPYRPGRLREGLGDVHIPMTGAHRVWERSDHDGHE